jgi:hypothetical protein
MVRFWNKASRVWTLPQVGGWGLESPLLLTQFHLIKMRREPNGLGKTIIRQFSRTDIIKLILAGPCIRQCVPAALLVKICYRLAVCPL